MAAGALGDLTGEGWVFYNAGDAPEGAWDFFAATDKTATITLPTSLSAGTWYIFLKMIDYDEHRSIYYTLGAATSATIYTDDRDYNSYWTVAASLVVVTPGSTIVMHLGNNAGAGHHHMFKGLFLTKDPDVVVTSTDEILSLTTPTVMDDSAAVKGNLVPNGSFETGVDSIWGFQSQGGGRTVPVNTMWDSSQGWDGTGCLKLACDSATRLDTSNNNEVLISRVFHLKPNKTYTASVYMKSSTTGQNGEVRLVNTYVPPAGFDPQYSITSGGVAINSSTWTRISVTGYAVAYPSPDFQIWILTNGTNGNYVLIDGIQLEEGSLSTYAPAATMEAAVLIDQSAKPGNIYFDTDTLTGTIKVRNHAGTSQSGRVYYEIYDWTNVIVGSGHVDVTIAATTTYSASFSIATGKTGIFRLVTWVDGKDRTEREINYSIIPPTTTTADETSYLGIHPNFYESELAAVQRLGVKLARALSPEAIGRWTIAEPSDNSFVFFDSHITAVLARNITPMISLGTNNYWPAWADSSGLPNLTKWAEYCQQMTAHYKTLGVKYYEFWNEPRSAFTAAFCAQMLKGMTDAVLTEDATAKVVAMGGVSGPDMQAIIDELASQYPAWDWQSKFTAMATHDYPDGRSPEEVTDIIGTYGVPVWNTESGAKCQGFYQGPNCGYVEWGKSIWPQQPAQRFYTGMIGAASMLAKSFLRTIGAGQTAYFYYDSRYYADPSYLRTHFSIWEYDGSIRAKGIAYAVAGSLIDHATTLGDASADANVFMYVFDGADPIASIWSKDFLPRTIVPSGLTAGQFECLDMMGNTFSISGTTIPFGRLIIYVRGIGISAVTLSSALAAGTISTRSDTAAPLLTIGDGPRGPLLSGEPFRMRFHAIDDTSFPNLGEINEETGTPSESPNPEALLYSYRLVGHDADWSVWSARTSVEYSGVSDGLYTFDVKVKDVAGNVSSATTRTVQLGDIPTRWLCAR
jgi:hypothetical protein